LWQKLDFNETLFICLDAAQGRRSSAGMVGHGLMQGAMNDSELEIKLQPPQKPLTEAEPTARSSLRVNVLLALITLVGAFATLWGVKVAERSRLDAKHLAEQQLTEQRRQFDAQLAEQKRQAKYNDDRAERSAIAAENSAEIDKVDPIVKTKIRAR
jgi:hypothetical protein